MRCPRRPAPHRPPRLIAPAGCPPAAAASGACQSAAAARWPGLEDSRLSGSCRAAHLEREAWGRGGARGEGSLGANLRSKENPPEDPWKSPTGSGRESRPPAAGGSLPGGAGRRAARHVLAAPRDPRVQSRRRGFPGAGRARGLRLARRHRGRRLGLAARGGDARRGWFLGEPRALPTKLQQEAKSKSQSPSLQTERHPISWERASCTK